MRYLAFAMKVFIMATGIFMMVSFPDTAKPPFMSWLAFFVIGAYLGLEGRYGARFSGCIFGRCDVKKKCCDKGGCKE